MMKRYLINRHGFVFLLTATICLTAAVCYGRVFWRWGTRNESSRAMLELGGKIAYQANINLNGGKGQIAVFSFDTPIFQVLRDLRRAFNSDNFRHSGGSMSTALLNSDESMLRFVIVETDSNRHTLVFKLEQTHREFNQSKKHIPHHLMKNIPAFPGSIPVFFAEDENSGMSLAVSKTASAPSGVLNFFDSHLAQSGWSPTMPAGRTRTAGLTNMTVYLKKREIACVLVDSSGNNNETRITLLYKRPGVRR